MAAVAKVDKAVEKCLADVVGALENAAPSPYTEQLLCMGETLLSLATPQASLKHRPNCKQGGDINQFFVYGHSGWGSPSGLPGVLPGAPLAPLHDIKLSYNPKKDEKLPEGYQLLKRTFDDRGANLNKGSGGKKINFALRRDPVGSVPRPLGAVGVIYGGKKQEPVPYGFEAVEKTLSDESGDLNHDNSGQSIFVCLHRTILNPAPILDIQVIFRDRPAIPPPGFHEIIKTLTGQSANLNLDNGGFPTFILLRSDITVMLRRFQEYIKHAPADIGSAILIRTVALVATCIYNTDLPLLTHAIDAFKTLTESVTIPAGLARVFVEVVSQGTPRMLSYLNAESAKAVVSLLAHLFRTFLNDLDLDALISLTEALFVLVRYDDDKTLQSLVSDLIALIITSSAAQKRISSPQGTGPNLLSPSSSSALSSLSTTSAPSRTRKSTVMTKPPVSSGSSGSSSSSSSSSKQQVRSEWSSALLAQSSSNGSSEVVALCSSIVHNIVDQASLFSQLSPHINSLAKPIHGEECHEAVRQVVTTLHTEPPDSGKDLIIPEGGAPPKPGGWATSELTKDDVAADWALLEDIDRELEREGEGGYEPGSPNRGYSPMRPGAKRTAKGQGGGALKVRRPATFLATQSKSWVGNQSVVIKLDFQEAIVSFHRVKRRKETVRHYSRASLLRVEKLDDGQSVLLEFGLPKAYKKSLKFKEHAQREMFFELLTGPDFEVMKQQISKDLLRKAMSSRNLKGENERDKSSKNSSKSDGRGISIEHLLEHVVKGARPDDLMRKLHAILFLCARLAWFPETTISAPGVPCRGNSELVVLGLSVMAHAVSAVSNNRKAVLVTSTPLRSYLNRFVCPSVANCLRTKNLFIFQKGVDTAVALWSFARPLLPTQIGVLVSSQIGALVSHFVPSKHKLAVLYSLPNTILHNYHSILSTYFNYDTQTQGPEVLTDLLSALTNLGLSQNVWENEKGAREGGAAMLRLQSYRSLVRFARLMFHWAVDFRSSTRSAVLAQRLKAKAAIDRMKHQVFDISRKENGEMKPIVKLLTQWYHDMHPKSTAAHTGITSVDDLGLPRFLAEFIYKNSDKLNKTEIGDFLAGWDNKLLTNKQYKALRKAYLGQMDFTGLTFDQAIRIYLCEGGFRLPGEAQKIDRILEAFCERFSAQNPGQFRTPSSAFVVSFAMIMLNTDLHDSRLRAGKNPTKRMTVEEFVGNLRGTDDGHDFPRAMLEELYYNIKAEGIEWKEAQEGGGNPGGGGGGGGKSGVSMGGSIGGGPSPLGASASSASLLGGSSMSGGSSAALAHSASAASVMTNQGNNPGPLSGSLAQGAGPADEDGEIGVTGNENALLRSREQRARQARREKWERERDKNLNTLARTALFRLREATYSAAATSGFGSVGLPDSNSNAGSHPSGSGAGASSSSTRTAWSTAWQIPPQDAGLQICELLITRLAEVWSTGLKSWDIPLIERCIKGAFFIARTAERLNQIEHKRQYEEIYKRLLFRLKLVKLRLAITVSSGYHALLQDRKFRLKTYQRALLGNELVDWLIVKGHVKNREMASEIGNALYQVGLGSSSEGQSFPFRDGSKFVYQFEAETRVCGASIVAIDLHEEDEEEESSGLNNSVTGHHSSNNINTINENEDGDSTIGASSGTSSTRSTKAGTAVHFNTESPVHTVSSVELAAISRRDLDMHDIERLDVVLSKIPLDLLILPAMLNSGEDAAAEGGLA